MIEPKEDDVGRSVVYTPRFPPDAKPEDGVISSMARDPWFVFVRYGLAEGGKLTPCDRLEWRNGTP